MNDSNILPMLTLNGLLMNSFMGNVYIDKETGESTPATLKIQMLCDVPQKAGVIRKELVTMSAKNEEHAALYESLMGEFIRVGVGVIPQGRNLNFWILPNSTPELVGAGAARSPVGQDKPKDMAGASAGSPVKSPLGN